MSMNGSKEKNKGMSAIELNCDNDKYRTALHYAAEISEKLIMRMDEDMQELFEEYVNVYESIKEMECYSRR